MNLLAFIFHVFKITFFDGSRKWGDNIHNFQYEKTEEKIERI